MTELRECPHCIKSCVDVYKDEFGSWVVSCGACGSSSGRLPDRKPGARALVIENWNTRAESAELTRLRGLVAECPPWLRKTIQQLEYYGDGEGTEAMKIRNLITRIEAVL